ncbi:MAG: response regulator [Elusimicrobia bacterium]|nr:response regulator [Elusimicrobiota bacterium]
MASILVIDDDKNQRSSLLFALGERGFKVEAAASGKEALELARKARFDAAVCDIMMPGMDGIETLRTLRKEQPWLEVVMATGFGTSETALKSMRLGACHYLTKPYELQDLIDVLDRALGRRRA